MPNLAIYNKENYQQHPQIRLIPWTIWVNLFRCFISPHELSLMTLPYEEAVSVFLSKSECMEQMRQLVCMYYAHSDINTQQFFQDISSKGAKKEAVFVLAALTGRLEILNTLCDLLKSSEVKGMLKAENYYAFRSAAANGHLEFINRFCELIPTEVVVMIKSYRYDAFCRAAENGHLDVLNRLCELAPAEVMKMINAENYYAFRWAAGNGHLDVVNRLCELAPAEVLVMIQAENYDAFRWAAGNGHLDVVNRLCELTPTEIVAMIQAENYYALRWAAVGKGHYDVVNFLLAYPVVLAYAERHEFEYGDRYVNPFIAQHLSKLHGMRDSLMQDNPMGVFDFATEQECLQGFYVLHNLIRRNDEVLLDEIHFLLGIPGIKKLVHSAVIPYGENGLLRLALRLGNQDACALLLTIPAVRALAETNNYYIDEAEGRFDLRAVAQNTDSSMLALGLVKPRMLKNAA